MSNRLSSSAPYWWAHLIENEDFHTNTSLAFGADGTDINHALNYETINLETHSANRCDGYHCHRNLSGCHFL